MAERRAPDRRRSGSGGALVALVAIYAALSPALASGSDRSRHPIDLGTLAGANSFAIGINPAGTMIVGESDDGHGQIRPVAWTHGRVIDLGTPSAPGEADGLDVNDRDVVVGTFGQTDDSAATEHGFSWYRGRLEILPGLPRAGATSARRINQWGEIAGSAFDADGHEHPVVWDSRGRIHDLGLPPGFTDGYLLALNNHGDVGGAAFAADGSERAFTWHEGTFRLLSTLGGPTAQVNVIDDHGVAAGIADVDETGTSEATLWRMRGAPSGLGFFSGGSFSWVLGTNGQGDYTGIASLSPTDPFPHVFVAHTGGPLLALPLLSGDYASNPSIAHGIDRHGDVVGASNVPDGDAHATLWLRAFEQAFVPASGASTGARPPGRARSGGAHVQHIREGDRL